MPSFCLVPPSEERDNKGITGTLHLFSPVSLRAFVSFMTHIPLVHVFHFVWIVPVRDVFLMKKVHLPGLRSWEEPTARGESLSSFYTNVFFGNRPCCLPTSLDHSHALGGGKDEVGLGPPLPSSAVVATTRFRPRK